MVIVIGIAIFLVGCIVSSIDDSASKIQRTYEKKHQELIESFDRQRAELSQRSKVTRRRVAKDAYGNTLAEEIIEETL